MVIIKLPHLNTIDYLHRRKITASVGGFLAPVNNNFCLHPYDTKVNLDCQ